MAPDPKAARRPPKDSWDMRPDEVLIQQSPPARGAGLTLWLLLALVIAAVAWASFSQVDRIVVARGKLVTTNPTIVVQPLDKAVVRSVEVEVGEFVSKGQLLASLDSTFTQADLNRLASAAKKLGAQLERLDAEQEGKAYEPTGPVEEDRRLQAELSKERTASYRFRLKAYDSQQAAIQSSLAGIESENRLLADRLAGLREIERMLVMLRKERHESKLSVLEARDRRLGVQLVLQQNIKDHKQLRQELVKLRAERDNYVNSWRQEITSKIIDTRSELDSLMEQISAARRKAELIYLRAPADAMVVEMAPISKGAVVQQTQIMFKLIPTNVPLEAEAEIEPRDIGFLRRGDEARVKIDAFPFQKHGTITAVVRSLSEDAVRSEKQPGKLAVYYLARLNIKKAELKSVPRDYRLIPGMTLTAEIKVGRRSVLSYLLYPVLRVMDEGIREP